MLRPYKERRSAEPTKGPQTEVCATKGEKQIPRYARNDSFG